ncbi:hypothetical protein CKO18_14435 [Rhodoferax fermentans]|nr:hypothetical protein [Rhodoferax fermentans]
MAGLIDAFQRLDGHLAPMLGASVRTSLVLQDIEAASLKSRLRTVIDAIPDEPLQQGDIKKLIGHFLLKGKHTILDWCGERNEISDREDVKRLEADLTKLAHDTDIKLLPAYAQIDTPSLLSDISAVNDAMVPLEKRDRATFASLEGRSSFNPDLVVSGEVIREIVTRERLENTGERILKVKKPDYLGTSKWTFKYGTLTIEAKICDEYWLDNFQKGLVELGPGDSLRVTLYEEVSYGYDNEVVHTEYEVRKVDVVVRGPKGNQIGLIGG